MREASRRAARSPLHGGLPNALFVVAAAESLPDELQGFADDVTVHFPWGSLLRGVVQAEPSILDGLLRVTRPGGSISMLLSVTEHDSESGFAPLDGAAVEALAPRYAEHGLRLAEGRPATSPEIAGAHSTWAKRLAAGPRREVWLLRFKRN